MISMELDKGICTIESSDCNTPRVPTPPRGGKTCRRREASNRFTTLTERSQYIHVALHALPRMHVLAARPFTTARIDPLQL